MSNPTLTDRFWSKVDQTEGCWNWTGSRDPGGYGRLFVDRRNALAHRVSYELHVAPIPEGLTIDHLCRNTSCVNPDHLEAVTLLVNLARVPRQPKPAKVKRSPARRCGKGHEFTPENTGYRKRLADDQSSFRYCITCKRQYMADYLRRRQAQGRP